MFQNNLNFIAKRQPTLARNLKNIKAKGIPSYDFVCDNRIPKPNAITVWLGARVSGELIDPNTQHLIIVEPSLSLLADSLTAIDLKKITRNIKDTIFLVTDDLNEITTFFYSYFKDDLRLSKVGAMEFCLRQGITDNEFNFFFEVRKIIANAIPSVLTSYRGDLDHARQGFKNFMVNSNQSFIDFEVYRNSQIGIPALIVSGGPSLEKDLESVRNFSGIVCAVDAVFTGLIKENIRVDFVLSMDRAIAVRDYFNYTTDVNTTLVCVPHINSEIVKQFTNRTVYIPTYQKLYLTALGYTDAFVTGTCVAHLAFSWAKYLGCSPIILVGQDFGMSTTHTNRYNKYVLNPDKVNKNKKLSISTKNKFGQDFKSSLGFWEMKQLFEDLIFRAKKDCEVYNSSHGLPISGTQDEELINIIPHLGVLKPNKVNVKYKRSAKFDKYQYKELLKKYINKINKIKAEKNLIKAEEKFMGMLTEPLFHDILTWHLAYNFILNRIENFKVLINNLNVGLVKEANDILYETILDHIQNLRKVIND